MSYRSTTFWVSDIKQAAEMLVSDSNAFHPANRKEFVCKVATEAVRILLDNAHPNQPADQGCSLKELVDLWNPAKTAPRDGSEFIAMNEETGETHPMRCYGAWGFAREDVRPKKSKQPFGTGRELDNESTSFRFTHWRVNAHSDRTDEGGSVQ